jgi:hypothetical protein
MTTPDTLPEAVERLRQVASSMRKFKAASIDAYELDSFANSIEALAAERDALRAELADGSFYQEKDIDAMQDTIAALRADNDRLRGALDQITDIEPDPDNMQRFHDIARAALDATKEKK